MKTGYIVGATAASGAIGFGVYMVDVEMTEEATLPDIDL